MEERVVFTGHLPHRLVLPAFHRADVFAFPSVAEGFGLAVAEAWLAEKPVVVDPGAGVTEIVEDGVNGVLADTGDPVAFADALARVLALPDGGAAMGEAGRRTAIAECDVRVRAAEVLEILEAHAERRKPDVEPSAAVARKETLR